MSRKTRIILVVLLAIVVVGTALGAGAYGYYRYTELGWLSAAEKAEKAQNWRAAKNNYAWYLTRHKDDGEVLEKYADACSKALENRNANCRDTGRAYFRIASRDVTQDEPITRLIDYQEKHHLWSDMEYATNYFLRQRNAGKASAGEQGLNARLRYLHAVALQRSGRAKEAIDAFTELTASGTQFVEAYGALMNLSQQQGLSEQIQSIMKQVEERFPDNAYLFLFRARQLLEARSFADAETAFQEALKRAPEDPVILTEALDASLKMRHWDVASEYADRLIKVAPERQEGYLGKSFLFERKGEPDKAIELLSGLDARLRADNPELFLTLAELQVANNRFDELAKTVEAYRSSYPDQTPIFDYLAGRELLAKGNPTEAATRLATVIKGAPEFVRAQFYEAIALIQSKQDDLAQGALESYIKSRPDDERARALWQSRFGGSTSREEAVSSAQALLGNADAGPYSLVFAARALMRYAVVPDAKESDISLVNQLLDQAIKLQPGEPSGYQALAEFQMGRKDTESAKKTMDRAEAAGADKRELVVLRAAVALMEGDEKSARGFLVEDLARPDLNGEDVTRWAEFLAGAGYLDKGIEALTLGSEKVKEEQRSDLYVEQLSLNTRYGTAERSLDILGEIEPKIAKTPALVKRLNGEKVALARALLRGESDDAQANKDKAIALLKAVETEEPTNASARVLRASLLLRQEPPDYTGAEKIVASVLEASPSDMDALLLMSDIAAGNGRQNQSLEFATRAAASAPPGAQAQLALADAQMRLQRYRDAQETLQRYIIAHPTGVRAIDMLIRAYGEQGKTREAKIIFERLEKMLAQEPNKARVLDPLRAKLAGYEGNWEDAVTALRKRFASNPDDMSAVQSLTIALVKVNQADEAEKLLKDFAQSHNSRPDAWTLLGQFYLARKSESLADASSAFTQALLIVPDYAPALRGLIEVQVRGNNRGTALSLCDRYLATQPDDSEILYRKAALLAQDKGRMGDALQAIDLALKVSERPEYLMTRGTIYLAQENFAEALKDVRRYAEMTGTTSAEVDMMSAEIYLGLHEKDLAQQYYESAKQKAAKAQSADTGRLERLAAKLAEESQKKP